MKKDVYMVSKYKEPIDQGFVLSIIQFGSSLRSDSPNDIDVAIITKSNCFEKFTAAIANYEPLPTKYDISLIQEEELTYTSDFKFGGHGSYLIESFRSGLVLYGVNPFIEFQKTPAEKIREDILERMREYVYVVRKSYFDEKALSKYNSRHLKCLRLFCYLLCNDYDLTEALSLSENECLYKLSSLGYTTSTSDNRSLFEQLWKAANK